MLTELLETHTQSASAPRERVNAQSRSTAPPILTRMLQTGSRVSTRESIHSAAARLFRTSGCARTTVRRIAAEAGTDPALVIRHFRSKELLFLETMHMTLDLGPLFDAPLDRLGERLAELLLDLGGSARGVFLALVHGGDEPHIRDRLRDTHEHLFVEPLRRRLTGPDADLRARTAAAVAGGLLYALWVAEDHVLLRLDRTELVSRYGTLLQEVLTPRGSLVSQVPWTARCIFPAAALIASCHRAGRQSQPVGVGRSHAGARRRQHPGARRTRVRPPREAASMRGREN